MTTAAVRPARGRLTGPAAAAGVLLVAGCVGVFAHGGHVFDAVPDTLRAGVPAVALFALWGYPVARLALPERMLPHLPLMVLPLGAVTSSLALTFLGIAHVPFDASLALVIAAAAVAAVLVRGRAMRTSRVRAGSHFASSGRRMWRLCWWR